MVYEEVSADCRTVHVLRQCKPMTKRLSKIAHRARLVKRKKSRLCGFLKRILVQANDFLQAGTVDAQYELWSWFDKLMMSDGESPTIERVNDVCTSHVGVPILIRVLV